MHSLSLSLLSAAHKLHGNRSAELAEAKFPCALLQNTNKQIYNSELPVRQVNVEVVTQYGYIKDGHIC